MVSLLDNAASGGLLADPRPALLAQLFDMSVKKRPTFLPMFRQQNGRIGLTAPQLLVDVVNSAMLPYAAAQGYRATPTDVSAMALDTMLGGGLLGRAPSGSLAVNVFHGTPHRFAPEPGFPYGRPRLDKMGTGEGAQAYGPGFYSAESKRVGDQYRRDLSGFDELVLTTKKGKIRGDELDDTDLEVAKYLEIGERDAGQFKHNTVYWAKKQAERDNKDEVLKRLEEYGPDARKGYERNFGTLYKLDIPDADAAKMLDWDKPLHKQPIAVREALNRSVMQRNRLDDELKKTERQIKTEASLNPADTSDFDSFFASPMSDKFNALIDRKIELQKEITDLPDRGFIAEVVKNNPDITGGEFFDLLKRNAGRLIGANPNRTQAESSAAAADALREAGIPGVKYLDRGSRGAGEGSRNYAIWDQDVLDRTKMLERDGEILGLLD